MSNVLSEDYARLAVIEREIRHLECSLSQLPLIPNMLSGFGADRARVADMEAEIRYLERALSRLRSEKTLVQERIQSYKYPVLSLPNELVSEIFLQFLPSYPRCPPLTGMLSPTALTQICRQWREIALTTPELWRAMRLDGNSAKRHDQIVIAWLGRSGCCPIAVFIDDEFGEEPDMECAKFMSALVAHRPRMEHLNLSHIRRDIFPLLDNPMPRLCSLDLSFYPGNNTDLVLHDAPLLRAVTLDGVDAFNRATLPWEQLTSLTLHRLSITECRTVLCQTSHLVHCRLELRFGGQLFGGRHNPALPDVALPHLESLVLIMRSPGFRLSRRENREMDRLRGFVCPALRILQIQEKLLGSGQPEERIRSLRSFISKSGCKLEELLFIGPRSIKLQEPSYRDSFPSIPRISFEEDDYEDSGLAALISHYDSGVPPLLAIQ
ncbi:hypothetical protein DFH06DRAFT_1474817 [Mycena polygramma]|nr:hypothetical protein DFH06DRAFT_1474817 [Mycena polygramma]